MWASDNFELHIGNVNIKRVNKIKYVSKINTDTHTNKEIKYNCYDIKTYI